MLKKEISIQICKLGNALNANEACQWMLMRTCLLAMLILMMVILMLILMLLNLNTGHADTDADLCNRIMSLCCTLNPKQVLLLTMLTLWKPRTLKILNTLYLSRHDHSYNIASLILYYQNLLFLVHFAVLNNLCIFHLSRYM